ncbi:MAG: hypothetical protein KF772_04545 [Cryobacterium sp.]|nr:hypothetical protein [Cryobacterium sp.]MBX3116405.1 hypothetical protein [Cryobacterium sp.]
MGVTVQVRNLDAAVQNRLQRSARQEGLSLSAFLRRELTTLARELEVQERAGYGVTLQSILGAPLRGLENVSTQDIVDAIHEGRAERM